MPTSLKPAWGYWLILILVVGLVWGNQWVLVKLTDIRHQSAPMPVEELVSSRPADGNDREIVRIGVVSRFAPNIIYRLYQPIMDYLNTHGERRHELALSDSYQDAALRLQRGEVQASFLGAWMCYQLPEDSGLEPVALPVNAEGVSRFHVVLITAEDSDIHSIGDLAGRRVAVPSDQAFSGNWLQNGGLRSAGLSPADLDTIQHFKHHDTVVWAVLRKEFDAGVVKQSLAHRYRSRGLRTVAVSSAIPGPPLVIDGRHRSEAVRDLVRLLLALDRNDPGDRALMQNWTPEFAFGFAPVDRAAFQQEFFQPTSPQGGTP